MEAGFQVVEETDQVFAEQLRQRAAHDAVDTGAARVGAGIAIEVGVETQAAVVEAQRVQAAHGRLDLHGIEAVLHYCCRDRNLLGMMSDLLGAAALGLHNLLIITGDPPKMGPYPDATAVFTMTDELLMRSHYVLMQRGRRIPDEVSLLAISDGLAPAFLFPNVTHFRHSGMEVGERTAHILIGLIAHRSDAMMDVRIRTTLVETGSVRVI